VLFLFPSVIIRVPFNGTQKKQKKNRNNADQVIRVFSVSFSDHPCPLQWDAEKAERNRNNADYLKWGG